MEALSLQDLKRMCRARGLATSGSKQQLLAQLSGSSAAVVRRDQPVTSGHLKQLKDQCRAAGLSVVGSRAELAARLAAASVATTSGNVENCKTTAAERKAVKQPSLRKGTTHSTPTETKPVKDNSGGNQQRRPDLSEVYEKLTISQLKELCVKQRLHASGPKEKLIARLRLSVLTIAELTEIARKIGAAGVGGKRVQCIEKLSITGVRDRALTELQILPLRPKVVRHKPTPPSAEERAQAEAKQTRHRAVMQKFQQSMLEAQPVARLLRPIVPASQATSTPCFVVYTVDGSARDPTSPSYGISRVYSSIESANAQVRRVFYGEHPDGWSSEDFERHARDVKESVENGVLALSLQSSHKVWRVSSICMPSDSSIVAKIRESYLVCSWQGYVMGVGSKYFPTVKFHGLCKEKPAANALAEAIFCHANPWELLSSEFDGENGRSARQESDGLISLSKMKGSRQDWQVNVLRCRGGEVPESDEAFIVYTKNICHATGDPLYEISSLVKTRQEANDLVMKIFYEHNPWGWARRDFNSRTVVSERSNDMLGLYIRFEGEWAVYSLEIPVGSTVSTADLQSRILILSMTGYNPQSRRPKEKLVLEIERVVTAEKQANLSVEEIFYSRNPYGWTRRQFHEDSIYYDPPQVVTRDDEGLMSIMIAPKNEKPWRVFALPFAREMHTREGVAWTTVATSGKRPLVKPSHVSKLTAASQPTIKSYEASTKRSAQREWFLVYSFYEKFPCEGPTYEFFPLFASKEEANAHVKQVFYKGNPWGWKQVDFDDAPNRTIKNARHEGLLKLSMSDEEEWTVRAVPVPPGSDIPTDDPTAAVVIHSAFGYLPDGFHAAMRWTKKIEAVVASKEAANARVKDIFNKSHSYECSIKQLMSTSYGNGADLVKDYTRGLLSMTLHPPDGESWSVYAQAVKKPKKQFRAVGDYYIREGDSSQSESDGDTYSGRGRPY